MAKLQLSAYADMRRSLDEAVSAHDAISQGIATHAERHTAEMDAKRMSAEHTANIEAGIERTRNQV